MAEPGRDRCPSSPLPLWPDQPSSVYVRAQPRAKMHYKHRPSPRPSCANNERDQLHVQPRGQCQGDRQIADRDSCRQHRPGSHLLRVGCRCNGDLGPAHAPGQGAVPGRAAGLRERRWLTLCLLATGYGQAIAYRLSCVCQKNGLKCQGYLRPTKTSATV